MWFYIVIGARTNGSGTLPWHQTMHVFGIYAISDVSEELGDETIIIDINQETVIDMGNKVDWDLFVQAYRPKVLVEQTV